MNVPEILEQIRRLPEEERREVTRQIFAEFGHSSSGPTLEQLEEMERRGEQLSRNPESGIPWGQVRAELKERIKSRTCPAK
jgi:putative addiction module component (TIGR02574 family)